MGEEQRQKKMCSEGKHVFRTAWMPRLLKRYAGILHLNWTKTTSSLSRKTA